jgi:ribosomal protein S18 acetylase RimI-like enzyme
MRVESERYHMQVRTANQNDRPAIRDVARRSLQASYSLEPKAIIGAIEEWYDESRLRDILNDDTKTLLVAERDGQVVGFSDSIVTGSGTGEVLWLHVDPDYRGEEVGRRLFERTREELAGAGGTTLNGRVLADNASGNAFYESQGFVKVGEEEVEIDGTPYVENVYAEVKEEGLRAVELTDGDSVYIDQENQETGSVAPFYAVYTHRDGEEMHGYWCSRCDAAANAMDAMGRIQCDECGNARKPTRWDSAYL